MTAALKRINIERAQEHGRSVTGPWVVEFGDTGDGRGMYYHLYHYGHLLAVVQNHSPTEKWTLKATPRPGFPFSKSDRDGIYLLAEVTGAQIQGKVRAASDAYRAFGMDRPFPLRPE